MRSRLHSASSLTSLNQRSPGFGVQAPRRRLLDSGQRIPAPGAKKQAGLRDIYIGATRGRDTQSA